MSDRRHRPVIRLVGSLCALCLATGTAAADTPDFDADIAPLLAARCLNCHGSSDPKGGLDLTTSNRAHVGGDSGPALIPGQPAESLLWQKVVEGEMPPQHPLPESERRRLRDWIEAGAKWGADPIDPLRYTTATRAGFDWWSWQPLADSPPVPPANASSNWVRNPIDAFVLARLDEAGLPPSPSASPRSLIRRLFIDLTGLPPSAAAVARFEADPSDAAYQALVEQLLASPQYGERWGRHWLDVARFGESNGFERNDPRDSLWPYRDWVIQALNADMPFDEFARAQIAGDLTIGGAEGAAAVGFLVCGVHNTVVGASERMKLLARQDELEEIAGALGQAFLGLTINCARCHDHKFDPVRNEEYYRFIAALDGIQHGDRAEGSKADSIERDQLNASLAVLRDRMAALRRSAAGRLAGSAGQPARGVADAVPPAPWRSWDFSSGVDDSTGTLKGNASGTARVENGALVLDGSPGCYVATDLLDRDLREKTLEVWLQIDELDQRGGAPLSLESPGSSKFDAIVFGELEPRRWMAGSENFTRTNSFAGSEETAAGGTIHVVLVYDADGGIRAYRNGIPYGIASQTVAQPFAAGTAHVLFGLRHSPPGGNRMFSGRLLHANLYDRALTAADVAASAVSGPEGPDDQALLAALFPEERMELERLSAESQRQAARTAAIEARRKPIYTVLSGKPGEMRVHLRGGVTDFGPVVSPGGIEAIAGPTAEFGLTPHASDRERRLRLADWVTVSGNALFTRVIVNRLWQHHFGSGLLETSSDFGFNGGTPSHPELLEWLAASLLENQFRLKPLHRLIVQSATYRQSSSPVASAVAVDAGNRLLWRYPPRRVEAEVLRDSLLQAAGALDLSPGGPGYRDVTLTALNGTTYYEPINEVRPEFCRRTVYRFVPRGGISSILETYDCPDPSVTSPRRNVTTTPLQALSLLNNPFVLSMSSRLADHVRSEAGDDQDSQIRLVWERCLGREPSGDESLLSRELVRDHGLAALARALFNSDEFTVIE